MINDRARLSLRIITAFFLLLTALLAFFSDYGGEEAGGDLTGPMLDLNAIGALFFSISILAVFSRWRIATALVTLGAFAILPWQSWRLFPGVWCSFFDAGKFDACKYADLMPVFSAELINLSCIASAGLSIFLTYQSVRK